MNVHSPAVQQDLARYNAAMEKSLQDKLFFLDHTAGAMTFVDFGCANGALLKGISERRGGNKTLIGIDINPVQRAMAEKKVPNGVFVSDFELVRGMVKESEGPRVAIFSSVLHEAPELMTEDRVCHFDYVVIRDTAITSTMATARTPQAWVERVALKAPEAAIKVWTEAGKGLANMAQFTAFLLKYPYLKGDCIQTQRELSEQYPLIGVEGITNNRDTSMAAIRFEHFSAPWVVDRVRQDFGFEFPFPTHFKLILKKVTA